MRLSQNFSIKHRDLEKAQIAKKSTPMFESVALQKSIMEHYILQLMRDKNAKIAQIAHSWLL